MARPVATCVWRLRPDVLVALQHRLGPPVDTYSNGSQAWVRSDGPDGTPIEWRLHPCPGFSRPGQVSSYHLFPAVVGALAQGEEPEIDPAEIWSGLDAAPAYGDPVDPAALAEGLTAVLGHPPDAFGLADHVELGQEWERSGGQLDVVARLLQLLGPPPAPGP